MRFSFLLILLIAGTSLAGKVVTYTASSNVSQEEANNTAIAGVAKQISSQVKANQTLNKEEVTVGKKSSYTENYRSSSQVISNIEIKGIKVSPVKTDKGFKATATLDLDEYTADIQFQIKGLREKIEDLQKTIQVSITERQYARAISALSEAKVHVSDYKKIVVQFAAIYPVDDSFQLKHSLPELETQIFKQLSQIRIEGPTEELTISKSEMPPWSVSVYDNAGPLMNFPLVAKQGSHVLLERRTQTDGQATFNLRNVNYEKGPYIIIVEPGFSDEILSATGLQEKFTLSYQVNESKCPVRIQCDEIANVCNALEKILLQKSIIVENSTDAPLLQLKIQSTEEKALKISDSMTRYSYNVDLSLKGKNVSFITSAKENGKNSSEAISKAFGKMDFTKLKQQLKCK